MGTPVPDEAVRGRRVHASVLWATLAILGFGASLWLIDAPPFVAYAHYRLSATSGLDVVAWLVLLLQGVLLVTAGRAGLMRIAQMARRRPGIVALLFVAMLLTSATPRFPVRRFLTELVLAGTVEIMAVLTLLLAAMNLPAGAVDALNRAADRLLGPPGVAGPARLDRWSVAVAASATVAAALLSLLAYQNHPHLPDEVVYLLHARYFARGLLALPLPSVPAAFNIDLMQYEPGRWYSPVPPGWPALLALGVRLGVPWLVNPLLAGVSLLTAYLLLGTMYEQRTVRLALLLLAASPWFLFMSMNLMTHAASLAFALAAALGVARARRSRAAWPAFLGGLALGVVSLIRPLEGLAVALLLGLWSLPIRGRWLRFAPSAALVAGTLATGLLVRPYNAVLTGSASTFPIMAYVDKYYGPGVNSLGFGPNRGIAFGGNDPFPGHGLPDVIVNAAFNFSAVNADLLGWPTGSMLLLVLPLALGIRRLARPDRWHLAVIATIVGIHSLYWFSGGPDFAARYWYLIIVSCVVLAARGLEGIAAAVNERTDVAPGPWPRAASMALVLSACAVVLFVPWRASGKYYHYRGMRPDIRVMAARRDFGRSVVFIRGRRFPDYASAAVYNPVDLRADSTVYAWDESAESRHQVVLAYSDRQFWFIDGPSITHDGYRIVAGPLSASAAMQSSLPVDLAGDAVHAYDPVYPHPAGPRP